MAHFCNEKNQLTTLADYAEKCRREEILSKQGIHRDKLALEKLFHRRLHMERQEAEMEEAVVRSQEMKRLQVNQIRQEENLAREMEKIKHADILEKKNRQLLRESSHEIKELERKLRSAYCVKTLHAQIAEKEAEKIKQKEDEKRLCQQLESARLKEADFRKKQEELGAIRKAEYLRELQDQIITSHQMKLCIYEKYLKEKKMIDDIVQRLHDEDMRELELKMDKKNRTRQEMEEFKKAQEEWRKRERHHLEQEAKRVVAEAEGMVDNEKIRLAKWKEKESAKERVRENICKMIKDEESRRTERERIASELTLEEARMRSEAEEKAELERTLRARVEQRRALDRQRAERLEALRQQERQDEDYRKQELIRLAESARLEQLTEAARRRQRLEHGRAVEAMMEDRRCRRAEAMRELILCEQAERSDENKRSRQIEEERIRILREHAAQLVGFLPAGVIKPEDQEVLGDLLVCPPKPEQNQKRLEPPTFDK